jgi:hypothetical protein
MSEFERIPDPGNNGESSPFDFASLSAEPVDMGSPEFEPPKTEKRKWWESRPRSKKTSEKSGEKKPRRTAELKPMPRGGLKPALAQMYTGLGIAVMPFDPSCGRVIIENADKCAESLDELAKTNPAVRNVLISLVTTSAWGAVIMAHAPILMAVMMHHVPFLRERQEKMVGEFAEMMANGFTQPKGDENTE